VVFHVFTNVLVILCIPTTSQIFNINIYIFRIWWFIPYTAVQFILAKGIENTTIALLQPPTKTILLSFLKGKKVLVYYNIHVSEYLYIIYTCSQIKGRKIILVHENSISIKRYSPTYAIYNSI